MTSQKISDMNKVSTTNGNKMALFLTYPNTHCITSEDNLSSDSEFLPPDVRPPQCLDLNPVDSSIWWNFTIKVFKREIQDFQHLREKLEEAWHQTIQNKIDSLIKGFRKTLKTHIKSDRKRFKYKQKHFE